MKDIYLARTTHSPEVDFRFSEHTLTITGEAYPENANEFFHPLLMGLERYLKSVDSRDIEFNFRLTYFNSAATKMRWITGRWRWTWPWRKCRTMVVAH